MELDIFGKEKQKMAMGRIRMEKNPRVMKALGRERKGTTRLPDPSFVVIDGEAKGKGGER